MFKKNKKTKNLFAYKRGFTLIELLVVIAIIGLLGGVVMISLQSVRAKTRDTQRVTSINTINTALNLYHTTYSAYPIFDGYITGSDALSTTLKSSGLINEIPIDPTNDGNYRYYYQSTDGQDFYLEYYLETNSINGKSEGRNFLIP